MEEIGIEVNPKFLFKKLITKETISHFIYIYYDLYTGAEIKIDNQVISAHKWIRIDEFEDFFKVNEFVNQLPLECVNKLKDTLNV